MVVEKRAVTYFETCDSDNSSANGRDQPEKLLYQLQRHMCLLANIEKYFLRDKFI